MAAAYFEGVKTAVSVWDAQFRAYAVANYPAQVVQYDQLMAQGNPHVKDWFMMNPIHCLIVCLLYFVIVQVGVMVMKQLVKEVPGKDGKPVKKGHFDMFIVAVIHNLQLIVLSSYMAYEIATNAWKHKYTLFCNPVDAVNQPQMANVLYIFYMSKILEFGDTFLMILKGNFKQVNFLHVYHHLTIFPIWWCVVFFAPGGDSYFSAFLNSVVHVVMYIYYLASVMKIPIPFKHLVTLMQMTQFCMMLGQAIYNISTCTAYPSFLAYLLAVYMLTLLYLFGQFYLATYNPSKNKVSGGVQVMKDVSPADRKKQQ